MILRFAYLLGCFPFSQKFRKFRFGAKWKTFFRFARLENSQKKWNCSKGSPVFPVGTSQWKFVFHLQNFSSLYQFHAFRGPFKWPGFPGPRFQKWRLIQVRFLEALNKLQGYYECSACYVLAPEHGNLLQHECALYKNGR